MKTVVITGGSRGIGKAAVAYFAEVGWQVVFCYKNNSESAEKISSLYPNVSHFKADVSKEDDVEALFDFSIKQLGHIDAVVCNAGIAMQKLFTCTSLEDWNNIFAVNSTGIFLCCRKAAEIMISQKQGSIINISSIFGESGGSCEVAYSASKASVIGLTKALAKELGPSNIRVNCISPGVINTDMNQNLSDEDLEVLKDETPLCRIGEPIEVARAIEFLADCDKSSFITGQIIPVNGGITL